MPKPWTPAKKKKKRDPLLVGSVLATTKSATARLAGVSLDWITWRDIVGERVARRTVPGKIEDGVLVVGVESPVWAQELSLLSEEVVGRLRRRGFAVSSIRFRPTPPQARVPAQRTKKQPAPLPLPDDLAERLALIDDAQLRETIATAASHSLGARAERQKTREARKLHARKKA
jgi:hypothetical protein